MERLKKIQELAKKALDMVKPLLDKDLREDPLVKSVSAAVPGLGLIVGAADWWFDWYDQRQVPERALDMLCEEYELDRRRIRTQPDLERELRRAGVTNPGLAYQRVVNKLFAELEYSKLVQYLADNNSQVLDSLTELTSRFTESLQTGYTYIMPLEKLLRMPPSNSAEALSMFFRDGGPLAVDLEEDKTFIRQELIDTAIDDLEKHSLSMILGIPASGKSVLARQVAYHFYRDKGWTVYTFTITRMGFECARLSEELVRLGRENHKALVVIENIHLSPEEVNTLLLFRDRNWPNLLLTSRRISSNYQFLPGEITQIKSIPTVETDLVSCNRAVMEMYNKTHPNAFDQNQLLNIQLYAGDDLWLLGEALKAVEAQDSNSEIRDSVIKTVNKRLDMLAHDHPIFPRLLVCLAILSHRQVEADEAFLAKCFGNNDSTIEAINNLVKRGIVKCQGLSPRRLFGMHHASQAELYLEVAEGTYWENRCCSNRKRFVAEYATSPLAANGLTVFSANLVDKETLEEMDVPTLASRLDIDSNPMLTINVLKTVNSLSPQFAEQLYNHSFFPILLEHIYDDQSLEWSGSVLNTLLEIRPAFREWLNKCLDIQRLGKVINNRINNWPTRIYYLSKIAELDRELATILFQKTEVVADASLPTVNWNIRDTLFRLQTLRELDRIKADAVLQMLRGQTATPEAAPSQSKPFSFLVSKPFNFDK